MACRYAAKSDWEVTHRDGEAFKALKTWTEESGIKIVKSGRSYFEGGVGFM